MALYEAGRTTQPPTAIANSLRGGSLNTISYDGPMLFKTYMGRIPRGHTKLQEEHQWFGMVPSRIRREYPRLFPTTVLTENRDGRSEDDRQTVLMMEKLDRRSITKLCFSGVLNANEASLWYSKALGLLANVIYPMRIVKDDYPIFMIYHLPRLELAARSFEIHPQLAHFMTDERVVLNGCEVPSIRVLLNWMEESTRFQSILGERYLFAIHGNLHIDNILIAEKAPPAVENITFIDPRGDLVGPVYYDSAKLMTTFHSYYDEIHYDRYSLARMDTGMLHEYQLTLESPVSETYKALLAVTRDWLTDLSAFTSLDRERFVLANLACQLLHIVSFSFYHLNRVKPDLSRVETFLLIACRLGDLTRRCMEHGLQDMPYAVRLQIPGI